MLARMSWPARLRAGGRRWLCVDALDAVVVAGTPIGSFRPTSSVEAGAEALRRRVELRRLLVVLRRAALVLAVGLAAVEAARLAWGEDPATAWLAVCAAPALVVLGANVNRRATRARAVRLLDRGVGLGAVASTALELETQPRGAQNGPLAGAALADGRRTLGLQSLRVRSRPSRGEWGVLAAAAAAAAALGAAHPAGGGGAGTAARGAVPPGSSGSAPASRRHPVGPTLSGFRETTVHAPPLAAIATGSARTGAAASGHSPYGGGIASKTGAGSSQPASSSLGSSGRIGSTRAGAAGSASEATGAGGTALKGSALGAVSSATGGIEALAPVGAAGATTGNGSSSSAARTPAAHAGSTAGSARGNGAGAAAAASGSRASAARRGTSGGATAGGAAGTTRSRTALVPELGGGSHLPIEPGYVAVRVAKGTVGASSAAGGGGGPARGAGVGAQAGGGGTGLAYVPPGDATVKDGVRQLLLGYFGASLGLKFTGW